MSRHATAPTAVVRTPGIAHRAGVLTTPLWTGVRLAARPEPSPGPTLPTWGQGEVTRSTHCRSSGIRSGLALTDVSIEQP